MTETERDQFVYYIIEYAPIPKEDSHKFDDDLGQLYDLGFTRGEALAWARTFEEVNPDLAEDVALDLRAQIGIRRLKYIAKFLQVDHLIDWKS